MKQPEGVERRVSGDTVLRAFVFTDLVGSTALTAQLGVDASERFRRDHFAMLAHQIGRHGGEEVKSVGDGVMATFPSVHRALDAAVAMQVSVYRTEPVRGLVPAMRIGISAGDAVPHRGDYYGLAVNEAARLCALAEGGEILVDSVVATIGGPTDHRFDPRGPVELRGLPEPVEVLELWWPRSRPRLDLPLPARIQAGAGVPFVGRVDAHARIAEVVGHARLGHRRGLVLAGEPGIGKTTVVSRSLRMAAEESPLAVLYGGCDEDVVRPYAPFADAFAHLAAASEDLLDALGDDIPVELVRLVPALAARLGVSPPAAGDADAERAALFSAVVDLLGRLGRRLPVVLVLDDLHWADTATLALFRHLLRVDVSLPLAVIATYRSTEVTSDHPLADTLGVLARLSGVAAMDLWGLGDHDVCSLVAASAGHELATDEVDFATRVARETAGNPFFIVEILRDLAERGLVQRDDAGRWRAEEDWTAQLPRTVRDVIVQRVARLGDAGPSVLSAAAVLGPTFSPELAAELLNVDLDTVVDGLDRAAAAALVTESAAVDGQLCFAHGLVQRTLYDNLGRLRRGRLHQRAAVALGARPVGQVPASEVARHWLAGGCADAPASLAAMVAAGEEALALLAPQQAVAWFEQARGLLHTASGSGVVSAGRVLLALGIAQRQAGFPQFRDTLLAAAADALDGDDHELLVSAALANTRGIQSTTGSSDAERIAVLDRALAVTAAGRSAERAQLLALAALERLHVAGYEQRRALADEALEHARRSGEDATVARVLILRHNAIRVPSTVGERLDDMALALTLTERGEDLLNRFWAAEHRARACSEAGDIIEVDRMLELCGTLADRLAQPGLHYYLAMHEAWRSLMRGDLAASEAAATSCLTVGRETGQHEATSMYTSQLLAVRREQGRQDELADRLHHALATNQLAALRSSVALLDASAGRLAEAEATFAVDAREHFAAVPVNTLWSSAMVQSAEVCALLGDRAAAEDLIALLSPYRGQLAHNSATCPGPLDTALGMVLATAGRHGDAVASFDDAAALCRRIGAPLMEARAEAARAALAPASAADAEERRGRARAIALAHGAAGMVAEIDRSLAERPGRA